MRGTDPLTIRQPAICKVPKSDRWCTEYCIFVTPVGNDGCDFLFPFLYGKILEGRELIMSKIKSLLSTYSGRIYVYLADGETGKRFLHDAEDEGFTFADGVKPTEREPDGIFAVNDDMTINYVGFIGHMAYRVADKIGNQPLIKIDYRDILKQAE